MRLKHPSMSTELLRDLVSKAEAGSGRMETWQTAANAIAREKGFWDKGKETVYLVEKVALISCEASEAIEALRKGDDAEFRVELADIALRLFDLAEELGIDLNKEMGTKSRRNIERPYKHGKAF